ncbi:hypothetical protein BN77_0287 [Rhizobium mesoamericanum STM3625]|uniref:Uncharacterized protein n=1 Tax=Rhizobium mesoamericanum STM3625 TaxID=1211777 RepID=K0Q0C6_9HYPH|nr:hypothetical protein BN77_0287 [Rhizobium mesoamericanum STM3625]
MKQRRCGPFWCLPAFQQPGLLKRHTFIAGSAVGSPSNPWQTKPNYAVSAALVHYLRDQALARFRGLHRLVPYVSGCLPFVLRVSGALELEEGLI